MRAGDLRHRLILQHKTTIKDAYNQPIETWTDWKTVWCAFEPLRGRERFAHQERSAESDVRFRIRYLDGVDSATTRGVLDGLTYDIQAVIDVDGRRRELHLMARRVV